MIAYQVEYFRLKNWLFRWFPVALLVGNLELWVGASSLTVPCAIVVVMAVLIFDIGAFRTRCSMRIAPFVVIYAFFIGVGVLSGIADDSTGIKRNLASLLPYFCGWLVLLAFKDVETPGSVTKVMTLSGGALAIIVIVWFASILLPGFQPDPDAIMDYKGDLVLPLGPSNFLAVVLMFFSIFAWRQNKLVWMLLVAGVAFTLSRFGLVFTMLAALVVMCMRWMPLWLLRWIPFFVSGVLFGLMLILGRGGEVAPTFAEGILPPSIEARAELWMSGVSMIAQSPIVPGSPGAFTSHLERIAWPRSEWGVHNFVLSIWIEFGLLGLLLYAGMIIYLMNRRSLLERRDEYLVKISIFFLFLYGCVENVVEVASFQMLFAYLICLLAANRRVKRA